MQPAVKAVEFGEPALSAALRKEKREEKGEDKMREGIPAEGGQTDIVSPETRPQMRNARRRDFSTLRDKEMSMKIVNIYSLDTNHTLI